MQLIPLDRHWQRFWPRSWLAIIAIVQMLLTDAIVALEIEIMILNIKYSFFFIGFIASFFFVLTWVSTFIVCCCRESRGCATYALIQHILSIVASCVLLFYDALFLRDPYTCLWPNNLCHNDQLNLHAFGMSLDTSNDISWLKFLLIKIQMACAAVMILMCVVYIVIYVYTTIRIHQKNKVADPHTIIELGRVQAPPRPLWPDPPRELPPSSKF